MIKKGKFLKKTVIINRGIPASGKSSIAKEIVSVLCVNGFDAVSCSTDDFFISNGEYHFDETKLREYHLKNQDRFYQALKNGCELVICDNTNLEPWEAKPYYNMAKEFEYKVILMDFKTRKLEDHIAAQTNYDYKHNIPKEIVQSMYERYDKYEELTKKSSYPTYRLPKREYNEDTQQVEIVDEPSELFYYDELIKIASDDYEKVKAIVGNMILKKMRDYDFNEIQLIPHRYKLIIQEFEKRADKTLTAYDLKPLLNKSIKQIERYVEDLQNEFHNIISLKSGKKNAFKLVDSFDVFLEAFKQFNQFDELIYLAQKSNPKLFKKLEYQTVTEDDIYLFKNSIFEQVENIQIFNILKQAIADHEYRNIQFKDQETFMTIKPIKLVFTDNNWYLAYVDESDHLQLGRVNFIDKLVYSKDKITYQKTTVEKHLKNLIYNLQNANTRFDTEKQIATLKASPSIAKYFDKNMKKFLSSQKFLRKEDDGSVVFTVEYTHDLEILPFVQKWLPDLIIIEPKELQEIYKQKLQITLTHYSL